MKRVTLNPASGPGPSKAERLPRGLLLGLALGLSSPAWVGAVGASGPAAMPAGQGMAGMDMRDMDMSDMPEGHAAAGKKLVETQCAGCHGARGLNDSPDYPLLAGQDAMYLAGALGAYRSGARRSDAMMAVTMGLSDQDIADVAAYFAACPYK